MPAQFFRLPTCFFLFLLNLTFVAGRTSTADDATAAFLNVDDSDVGRLLETELLSVDTVSWVERNDVRVVLQEQQLQAAFGPRAVAERARLGRLLKADVLVLLRQSPNRSPTHQLVVCETKQGLRISASEFPASDDAEADSRALKAEILRALHKAKRRAIEICAVPRFVSRDLTFEHHRQRDSFRRLVADYLSRQPGILLVELEEARAIALEHRLTGDGSGVRRVAPTFLLGEFRNEGTGDSLRTTVTLTFQRNDERIGQELLERLAPRDVPSQMFDAVDRFLATAHIERTNRPIDPTEQVAVMRKQASLLRRTGDSSAALELIDAALLLQPESRTLHEDALYTLLRLRGGDDNYIRALEHFESLTSNSDEGSRHAMLSMTQQLQSWSQQRRGSPGPPLSFTPARSVKALAVEREMLLRLIKSQLNSGKDATPFAEWLLRSSSAKAMGMPSLMHRALMNETLKLLEIWSRSRMPYVYSRACSVAEFPYLQSCAQVISDTQCKR